MGYSSDVKPRREDPHIGRPGYQTFDQAGASNSEAKLEAIHLPADLTGKSFLDVGCNEGFFCLEARRRGADRVVGIDRSADFIARARERGEGIEYLHQSWTQLPDEKFDVIIMLSALHYEERPRELLSRLRDHLTDDGLLILEVGIAPERGRWRVWTQRKGVVYHPTWDLLYESYLEPFAFRVVGRSVNQPADPVHRWVVHCRRRKTNVVLITGGVKDGKSTLARQLGGHRLVTIETDAVLRRLLDSMTRPDTPILEVLQEFGATGNRYFGQMTDAIVDAGLADDFGAILAAHIPLDEPTVLVEGYALQGDILASLIRHLEDGARVWTTARQWTGDGSGLLLGEELDTTESPSSRRDPADATRPSTSVRAPEGSAGDSQYAVLRRERDAVRKERDALQARLDRLTARRSVRAALRLSKLTRPLAERLHR